MEQHNKHEEIIEQSWQKVLETYDGRVVLWSIMNKSGMNNYAAIGDFRDYLKAGRQQLASELLNQYVNTDGLDIYLKTLSEGDQRIQEIELLNKRTQEEL